MNVNWQHFYRCIFISFCMQQFFVVVSLHAEDLNEAENRAVTEARISQLKKNIDNLQKGLEEQTGKLNDLQKQLKETELEISNLQRQVINMNSEIRLKEEEFSQLKARKKNLELQKKQQEQKLASQLRASYIMGRQAYVKLMLNQENPEKVSRMMKYYEYFNQARIGHIDAFQETLQELATVESSILQKKTELELNKTNLQLEQDKLAFAQKQHEVVIASMKQAIASDHQRLNDFKKDQSQFENLLMGVSQAVDAVVVPNKYVNFAKNKGKMPWPVQGKLEKSFGSKNQDSITSNGILIASDAGTQVKAIHPGRVVFANWMRSFGLMMIIDHGNGFMTLYAHNESLLKDVGAWVDKGESIATVGKTGGRDKSALYFEIRRNGKPDNPMKWLESVSIRSSISAESNCCG